VPRKTKPKTAKPIQIDIMPEKDRRRQVILRNLDALRAAVARGDVTELCIISGKSTEADPMNDAFGVYCGWDNLVSLAGVIAVAQHDVIARISAGSKGE